MIVGILNKLQCSYTKGVVYYLWYIGILVLSLPIDIYYTYRVAQKY